MRKPPRYVQQFVDKTDRARFYFRRPGHKRVPLPGLPWSPDFMAAYDAAMKGEPLAIGGAKTVPGTINALCIAYYSSASFLNLKPISQKGNRAVIERFRLEHGDRSVTGLQRKHIEAMIAKLADRPAAANRFRKLLRLLMRHAVETDLRKDDPTVGIRKLNDRSTGFHSWTEGEIERFETKFAVGTRERLAFDLLLYTAQRREDVRTMGRQHVRDGRIVIRQSKTAEEVSIPIHANLAASLATVPAGQMAFVLTAQGKPFTVAGFGGWFRDCFNEAGLTHCAAHGLRKAACRRLAEAGCSASEIMAVSGHRSLSEAQKYVEAANRSKMADSAMARIASRTKIVKLNE